MGKRLYDALSETRKCFIAVAFQLRFRKYH